MRHPRTMDDSGTTHVLEAVIIASIMLSAIVFVTTFETPPSGAHNTRALLQQQAEDAISILLDTPVTSTKGDDLLSVLIAECLQHHCDDLTEKLDHLLPVGSSYALYISNGYDTFPVYFENEPAGEAITAKRLWEPHWSYTFTSASAANVNNWTDPMGIYALPVYNSNVVSPGGSPLKVTVEGTRRSDGSNYHLEAFYTTLAGDESDAGKIPAVSLNFLVNRTTFGYLGGYFPGAYWDRLYEATKQSTGMPTNESLTFRVQLTESAGATVPAGTTITVNIPRGWNATGWNDETWEVLQHATDWNASSVGSDVVAKLKVDVKSATKEFKFNATYHGDIVNDYLFRAYLSRGADAEANVIVHADNYPDQTLTFSPPTVVLSAPRPMGAGVADKTTWSLSVNIPYNPAATLVVTKTGIAGSASMKVNQNPNAEPRYPSDCDVNAEAGSAAQCFTGTQTQVRNSNAITIKTIRIEEQDGADIFGDVTELDPAVLALSAGTWENQGDALVWTGSHDSGGGALALTFDVKASGEAGKAAPKLQITPPVSYDTFTGRLTQQTSPGLWRSYILPNASHGQAYDTVYRGYNATPETPYSPLDHTFRTDPVYRSTKLAGGYDYALNPISPFQDAVYGSYVDVGKRIVPIGGQAALTVDVQSLLYALTQVGQNAGVKVTIYPPWEGDSHENPVFEKSNLESGLFATEINQLFLLDVTNDGVPDPIVGTTTGRVYALDALTGERAAGNTWTAPVHSLDPGAVSAILQLATIEIGGDDYIVVGTDGQSDIYVLDKEFNAKWSFPKTVDSAGLDTSIDFTLDGQNDIIVALPDATVYVLEALPASTTLSPVTGPLGVLGSFYQGEGTPTFIAGVDSVGPNDKRGFIVSLLSKPGADLGLRLDADNPLQPETNPQIIASAPAAGIDVVDSSGYPAWTYYEAPVTVAKPYDDANADGAQEIVVGTTSGYVSLLDGEKGSAMSAGAAWIPSVAAIDGVAHDNGRAAFLTKGGGIYFTYDGWNVYNCVNCDAAQQYSQVDTRLKGVALSAPGNLWAVGDQGALYHSIDSVAGQALMGPVPITTTTKAGVAYPAVASSHDFKAISWKWMSQEGWVVGSPLIGACTLLPPLDTLCSESLVMHTENNGVDWEVFTSKDPDGAGPETPTLLSSTGGLVSKLLTRINFTTEQVGWIAGEGGTLLRTTNGGDHWQGLALPTTSDIYDISCSPSAPQNCYVVGSDGVLLKTTTALNATTPDPPYFYNISSRISADFARPLYAAGVFNDDHAVVGTTDDMYMTWNAGENWTVIPSTSVWNNISRISVLPDGSGYVYGGNDTSSYMYYLASYLSHSTAISQDLAEGALAGKDITHVDVAAVISTVGGDSASAAVSISADGGAHWVDAQLVEVQPGVSAQNGVNVQLPSTTFTAAIPAPYQDDDLRVKFEFTTDSDLAMSTARVLQFSATAYWDEAGVEQSAEYPLDLTDPAMKHPDTTATWDTHAGEIRNPYAKKHWTVNVSGQVNDIAIGASVAGDASKDVWVATGDTFSTNNPDYVAFGGYGANDLVGPDYRLYLLDGATGVIVAKTKSLPAPLTQIRLADDDDADTIPDVVFVSTVSAVAGTDAIYAFDAATLAPLDDPLEIFPQWYEPTGNTGTSPVRDMEVGWIEDSPTIIYGTGKSTSGTTEVSGMVTQVRLDNAQRVWGSTADVRGQYTMGVDVEPHWLFGPYVVEVTVEWTDNVISRESGTPVAREVLQSARYYDYFIVTPPDMLAPPSPIYDVHLVAWMDDWR